jgi:hypothetical protein
MYLDGLEHFHLEVRMFLQVAVQLLNLGEEVIIPAISLRRRLV